MQCNLKISDISNLTSCYKYNFLRNCYDKFITLFACNIDGAKKFNSCTDAETNAYCWYFLSISMCRDIMRKFNELIIAKLTVGIVYAMY